MAQHVVVADFLSRPSQFPIQEMYQRMGPEQHPRHPLQESDDVVPANRVSAFMDQDIG